MADFLYVFRGGMSGTQHFSPEQMQKHMQAWGNWIGELSKRGQFKGGDPLDAGGKQVKGKKKTIVAVAHTILVIAYHIIKNQRPYQELGADYFDRLDQNALQRRLVKRLTSLGYQVTLTPTSTQALG